MGTHLSVSIIIYLLCIYKIYLYTCLKVLIKKLLYMKYFSVSGDTTVREAFAFTLISFLPSDWCPHCLGQSPSQFLVIMSNPQLRQEVFSKLQCTGIGIGWLVISFSSWLRHFPGHRTYSECCFLQTILFTIHIVEFRNY